MKRIWFAVIFTAICVCACIGEQAYIRSFHNELNNKIIAAEKSTSRQSIKAIQDYYKKSSRLMTGICDTERLDELNQSIKYLDEKDKDIGAALATARTINDSIFEAQIISASNVF